MSCLTGRESGLRTFVGALERHVGIGKQVFD